TERRARIDARIASLAERHAALLERRGAARSEASFRLGVVTGAELVPGNLCRVELDNRVARETLFAAIEAAKEQVLLQFYIFEVSNFSEELAVRLIRRARAGVRIRILVDALYSQQNVLGATNPILVGLEGEPNIEVRAVEPIATPDRIETVRLKARDHRKLAVFDSERAFISGRNAGDAYYTGFDEVPIADFTHHDRIPWLDAHVEVEGPVVAQVIRCFRDSFTRAGGSPFELPPAPSPRTGRRAALARLVVHEGLSDANALAAYESIIDSARERVIVVNDFPVLPTLQAAVRRALSRGVEVIFLTGNGMARRGDGTFFRGPLYRELFEYMTKHRLERMLVEGVKAYEYQTLPLPNVVCRGGVLRPYVHAKLMLADRKVLSVGSANLDVTASYWEREANLVIEGGREVARVERIVGRLIRQSVPLDLRSPSWRREAPQRELVSRLWPDRIFS
ncbi:MAG: phosphatidylserine/phosphatidylglycerophosphate/cardiolipin synthase family protein, partial [Polyangiaceae bacterium]|nr:phosphatidylserine/phosphatidylglycerophosphate/cardiolipin synthase family protein [Polyangiaceae bacterium]